MKPNVIVIDDFIPNSQDLLDKIMANTVWNEQFRSRKTASFGVNYQYNGVVYDELPMPDYLQDLAIKIHEKLRLLPNNCLINYYQNGQSKMGFHVDDVSQMVTGTGVAIISLGATREMTYRLLTDKSIKIAYPLISGSLLYMDDKVQQLWQHAILADKNIGTEPRLSLTFRQLHI